MTTSLAAGLALLVSTAACGSGQDSSRTAANNIAAAPPPIRVADSPSVAIVRRAYEAASRGDTSAFASLAGGATWIGAGSPRRPLRLADLRMESGCVLREIAAASANAVVASGSCSAHNLPEHSWPYESRIETRDGKIVSFERVPFEW